MPTTPPTSAVPRPIADSSRTRRAVVVTALTLLVLAVLVVLATRAAPLATWWNVRAAASVAGVTIAGTLAAIGLRGVRCAARFAVGGRHDAESTADLTEYAPRRVLHVIAVLALLAGALVALVETIVELTALSDPADLGRAVATQLLGLTYGAALAFGCVILAARLPRVTAPGPADPARHTVLIAAAVTTTIVAAAMLIIAAILQR